MTEYPTLSIEPTIDWGPGWALVGDGEQQDLDASLAVHELAMDGDTIASIEISTSAGTRRLDVSAGIELTRGDCLALATRLLEIAASDGRMDA